MLAENLISLVLSSGELESLEIISPNVSSTLIFVEFVISFRLSRYWLYICFNSNTYFSWTFLSTID